MSSLNLNMALLKDILPDLYYLGEKKKDQSKKVFRAISKIKNDQISKYQYVKKINEELNMVYDQIKRIEYQDVVKDSDLYYYYDKVLEEIVYLINKLRKTKRGKKIHHFKFFYQRLDIYMSKETNEMNIGKVQDMSEDQKEMENESDDASVTPRKPQINFQTELNIADDSEKESRIAKSVGPIKVKKQKRTRKFCEDRDKSTRNKFTCFCNPSLKMNLSQYIIHKNTVHKVSSQVLNNEINQMISQKPKSDRSNVIKMVSHDTRSENGLSHRKSIKYDLKQKRKLYDPEDENEYD